MITPEGAFRMGLDVFIRQLCQGSETVYRRRMVFEDGYAECVRKFYLHSPQIVLNIEEVQPLFEDDVIPQRFLVAFASIERHYFGHEVEK